MDNNLVIMFEKGGWIFYVILFLSVVSLGFVIERMLWLWRADVQDESFYTQFQSMTSSGTPTRELLEFCRNENSGLADLFAFGIENRDLGLLALRRLLLDYYTEEIQPRFEANVGALATIGRVAPMLGLFGTVYGMMGAFNKMAESATQAKPQDLAGDINIALATTVGGLFVALVVIFFHTFIVHRVRKRQRLYQRRLGESLRVLSRLAPVED